MKTDWCRSGAYVTTTDSPASTAALTTTPFGTSVMSLSFCPLPGSTHSEHGQLSRSQTAGKRSMRSPALSSSPPSLQFSIGTPIIGAKVGYTS